MPSIFNLWKDGKLERGTIIGVPIEKRKFTLPSIFTGYEDQTIRTENWFDESMPLTRCMCVSTGKLFNNNSQLLLIGEVVPIPVTLTAYVGAINGSVAINMTCAALLSLPNQLISARSINLEQIKKYNNIAINGEYNWKEYWVDDYVSMTSMPGREISGGLCYMYDGNEQCSSGLYEIIRGGTTTIEGEKFEKPIRFGETYTNLIRPVYYVDVINPALEMEYSADAWFVQLETK